MAKSHRRSKRRQSRLNNNHLVSHRTDRSPSQTRRDFMLRTVSRARSEYSKFPQECNTQYKIELNERSRRKFGRRIVNDDPVFVGIPPVLQAPKIHILKSQIADRTEDGHIRFTKDGLVMPRTDAIRITNPVNGQPLDIRVLKPFVPYCRDGSMSICDDNPDIVVPVGGSLYDGTGAESIEIAIPDEFWTDDKVYPWVRYCDELGKWLAFQVPDFTIRNLIFSAVFLPEVYDKLADGKVSRKSYKRTVAVQIPPSVTSFNEDDKLFHFIVPEPVRMPCRPVTEDVDIRNDFEFSSGEEKVSPPLDREMCYVMVVRNPEDPLGELSEPLFIPESVYMERKLVPGTTGFMQWPISWPHPESEAGACERELDMDKCDKRGRCTVEVCKSWWNPFGKGQKKCCPRSTGCEGSCESAYSNTVDALQRNGEDSPRRARRKKDRKVGSRRRTMRR